MGKLMLTCHKCGFVAAIDSREVALDERLDIRRHR